MHRSTERTLCPREHSFQFFCKEGFGIDGYITLRRRAAGEFIERKSRFIGAIAPVSSEEEARAFLAERHALHRDASHNTFAFVLRDGLRRCSDDGEPQGTAGVPLLDCLQKEGLVDVALVVTRYFGGILLGAGGLVRAYSHTAKLAVDAAERRTIRPCLLCTLALDYALYGKISYLLPQYDCVLQDSDFGTVVNLTLLFAQEAYPAFLQALTELTAALVVPHILQECFGEVPAHNK